MGGRILIVDELATNRIMLKVRLGAAHYAVLQASTAPEAGRIARRSKPDMVIADARLTGDQGLALCRRLKSDPVTASIPVIMVAAGADTDLRRATLEAGADDILDKPVDQVVLLARVRNLLRDRDTAEELRLREGTDAALGFSGAQGFAEAQATLEGPPRIALLATDPLTARRWTGLLAQEMPSAQVAPLAAAEALSGLAGAEETEVFVIATGQQPDAGDGLDLMTELRSRPSTRHCPVIVVQSGDDRALTARAFDLGASDVQPDGFDPREMALRLTAQIRRKRQGDRLRAGVRDGLRAAVIDPLTGLYNRRYALPHLARVRDDARIKGKAFAVMVADLDHFKRINDRFGHTCGDRVLTDIAQRLSGNLRAKDLIARIGGEEFLIVMPDTGREAARIAASRLCKVVRETPVELETGGQSVPVSISIGVAVVEPGPRDSCPEISTVMANADEALYGAKSHGRNQFTLSSCAA